MRNYYVSINYEYSMISLAATSRPPKYNELTGTVWALFIIACVIVGAGLGIPIVFSLMKNCKRSKVNLDVSTYMDLTSHSEISTE